jgi:hypothetical protein
MPVVYRVAPRTDEGYAAHRWERHRGCADGMFSPPITPRLVSRVGWPVRCKVDTVVGCLRRTLSLSSDPNPCTSPSGATLELGVPSCPAQAGGVGRWGHNTRAARAIRFQAGACTLVEQMRRNGRGVQAVLEQQRCTPVARATGTCHQLAVHADSSTLLPIPTSRAWQTACWRAHSPRCLRLSRNPSTA